MKITKKLLAILLSIVMIFSVSTAAFNAYAQDEEVTPVIFLPGIGQSQTYKYDEEGNIVASWNLLHVNEFWSSGDISEWISVLPFIIEFGESLVAQKDVIKASTIDNLFKVLFKDHLRGEDGKFVENVETPNYPYPVSEYPTSESDIHGEDFKYDARRIFLNRVPCQSVIDEIGGDNVYCYNYSIFSNIDENSRGLNDYIENVVLPQTGASKVILVPMSMGASVVNSYLDLYPDAGRVAKVVSIVGAWQGSDVFGDLMLANFDENAPDLVYTDALYNSGIITDSYLASIVNIAVRILPKEELDNILVDAIGGFVRTLVVPNTSLLGINPPEKYDQISEKYLSDESLEATKAVTDRYADAQRNLKERLEYQQEKNGTEFYFISGYDLCFGAEDFAFFKFFESYDETNSDEVIQIASTAPGTSSVPAGQKFSDEYIADPSHNVSPDGSIDASTCYYEKTTWYFHGQKHDLINNTAALNLAFDIALGNVKTVDDCKNTYPQFNNMRNVKQINRYLDDAEMLLTLNILDPSEQAELEALVAEAKALEAETAVDTDKDSAMEEKVRSAMADFVAKYNLNSKENMEEFNYTGFDRSQYKEDNGPDTMTKILNVVLGTVSKVLHAVFGTAGFSEFFYVLINK